MKRYLLYIVLTVVLSTAGCTRGQWLDEVVAQRDEQEEVVTLLRACYNQDLTVDSAEEIERTNKYNTGNSNNEEFKRCRIVFSDKTTVEFDVLGALNGVQSEYYAERGLSYISEVQLSDIYVSVMLVDPNDGWATYFVFLNTNPNAPKLSKIYYTSTDGNVVTPSYSSSFDANIISNTYKNGQGVITFDGYVTKIGDYAFNNCGRLASITIPDGVTSIGEWAFRECSSLVSITIPEGVTSIGDYAFWCCSSLASVTIPNGITSIGKEAFYCCSSLVSITIPEGVTSIGNETFWCCSSLTSITIPDSVTSIGDWAFDGCTSLTSITIPDSVTSIGDRAFRDCSSLASVTIGNGVTSIGESAFYDCSSLASVTIGNGVTSIGTQAFYGCSSLTSITIPEGVTSIGNWAFCECWSLANVTIPDSVTSIGDYAFNNCGRLASVYCKATTPPTAIISNSLYGWGAFTSNASGRKIYVPEESVEAYKTADGWSDYAKAFVPYDFEKGEIVYSETQKIYYTSTDGNVVTPIATNVFGANIVSNTYENGQGVITFDGEVTKIGDSAFWDCSSLASITIPESVTSIGFQAFYRCWGLASITIPDSVTSIGEWAFYGCSGLASITIPDGVTSIGNRAFSYCYSLSSVTIPECVTSIGYQAFSACSSLASITIPDSVTSIGEGAFRYCSSLASVYCKATTPPTAVPDYYSNWDAFDDNASDRKIYVPEESVEAYKTAEWWSEYADAFEPYVFE